LHGHNYEVVVVAAATVLDEHGMVIEAAKLDGMMLPFVEMVDHQTLNDVLDANPTTERLAMIIYEDYLRPKFPPNVQLQTVTVNETARLSASYRRQPLPPEPQ